MRYIHHILIVALASLLFFSCKKEDQKLNTTVSPVTSFFAPADSAFYDLQNTSSILFEWDQAAAADGNLVLYTIAFDKPSGDFSNPIYTMASDGNGLYNRATLAKDVLNKICKLAGVEPLASGTLKWTVYSSKGVNKIVASKTRSIKLQRPFGLDNPPVDVYISGTATEGGSDLAKAIKFKQTGTGTYELYTSLKPGTYQFSDKITGTSINYYYVSGSNIKEGTDGTTISTTGTKIYRINLDFNVLTVKQTEIKEVGLWFSPDNKVQFNLNYDKNGIWRATNQPIVFHQESWGRDERYKFRYLVNNGSADSYEFWGSKNSDNNRPTAATDASFWYLVPVTNAQYDNSFKFVSEADNHNCDVNLYMSPDKANYTHEVIPK